MRLDLVVELKTVDLVRETAWTALGEQLGWEGTLLDLRRGTLWRFEGEAASDPVMTSALDAELERSSAFYNPNKERRRFLPPGSLAEGEVLTADGALPVPERGEGPRWRAQLWITEDGGAREALRLRGAPRLAAEGLRLRALRSGTLWMLELAARDAARARGYLIGLALSRSRREGLLFNPHYQEGRLLTLTPAPESAGFDGGGALAGLADHE